MTSPPPRVGSPISPHHHKDLLPPLKPGAAQSRSSLPGPRRDHRLPPALRRAPPRYLPGTHLPRTPHGRHRGDNSNLRGAGFSLLCEPANGNDSMETSRAELSSCPLPQPSWPRPGNKSSTPTSISTTPPAHRVSPGRRKPTASSTSQSFPKPTPRWSVRSESLERSSSKPAPGLEDNQWILDLARDHRMILGFVGHLDPEHARVPGQHLARFSRSQLFRGASASTATPSTAGVTRPAFIEDLQPARRRQPHDGCAIGKRHHAAGRACSR